MKWLVQTFAKWYHIVHEPPILRQCSPRMLVDVGCLQIGPRGSPPLLRVAQEVVEVSPWERTQHDSTRLGSVIFQLDLEFRLYCALLILFWHARCTCCLAAWLCWSLLTGFAWDVGRCMYSALLSVQACSSSLLSWGSYGKIWLNSCLGSFKRAFLKHCAHTRTWHLDTSKSVPFFARTIRMALAVWDSGVKLLLKKSRRACTKTIEKCVSTIQELENFLETTSEEPQWCICSSNDLKPCLYSSFFIWYILIFISILSCPVRRSW